ncbi:MAG: hypothetical protein IKI31_00695, partial [Treponema sp.]|nr:hypothetical protein [Treponema sp.]
MKKLLSVSLFLFFALSKFFSQAGVDVFHDFYSSATHWHRNNIIEELPQFKPYPIQTIKSILEKVIQEGDEENKTLAKNYYKSIFGKPWNISFFADERNIFFQREWTEEKSFKLQSSFLLETFGDAFFGNTFGLSYQAGACLVGFNESARENWGATSRYDTLVKSVEAGPVVFNFNGDVVFSAVKNKMDFLLGYSRVGFAPFLDDDVAFSPT